MSIVQVTCPCCAHTFEATFVRKPRQLMEKTCKQCNKPYKTYKESRLYCSQSCYSQARHKRLPGAEQAMYARYQQGETLQSVGRAYGITKQRVQIIFRRNGFAMRKPGRMSGAPQKQEA